MRYRKYLTKHVFSILLTLVYGIGHAQDPADDLPPDPGASTLVVTKVQDMNFGAFSVTGSGGTITLSNSGSRSATGGVFLLNMGYLFHPAIFDVETQTGTIISITNGPDVTLTGSNGGSMTLKLGNSNPASPFVSAVSPPSRTAVHIGGTLTAGSSCPPGIYSGTFQVTFNYQ